MKNELEKIDSALGLLKEFHNATAHVGEHIQKMRLAALYKDGALPAKHKLLAAMLWSIAAKCEPCLHYYVQAAQKRGATSEEVAEFLKVASTMGGCVGEMWALKAFQAAQGTSADAKVQKTACCREET